MRSWCRSLEGPCGCLEHFRECCVISFCPYWYRCIWNLKRGECNKQKKVVSDQAKFRSLQSTIFDEIIIENTISPTLYFHGIPIWICPSRLSVPSTGCDSSLSEEFRSCCEQSTLVTTGQHQSTTGQHWHWSTTGTTNDDDFFVSSARV